MSCATGWCGCSLATKGQHVGGLRDALVEDEDLTAARRNQKVLAAAVKPRALPRSYGDIGDGDKCPTPGHGRMLYLQGTDRQYCPDQSHDGRWVVGEKEPLTRSSWPQGHQSFDAAVAAYHRPSVGAAIELPDLDIGELNA